MKVLRVYYDVKKPYTYCRVTVGKRRGLAVTESGFARCNAEDKWDDALGRELAYARALKDATRGYLRELEREVHRVPNCAKIAQAPKYNGKAPTPTGRTQCQQCELVDGLHTMIAGAMIDGQAVDHDR